MIASPDQSTEQIIASADHEIAAVSGKNLNEDEIERAKKQRGPFAYGSESITNQAFWMGYSAMFSEHTWFDNYIENISRVTAQQIHDAAKINLDRGPPCDRYLPTHRSRLTMPAMISPTSRIPGPESIRISRLQNGIQLLSFENWNAQSIYTAAAVTMIRLNLRTSHPIYSQGVTTNIPFQSFHDQLEAAGAIIQLQRPSCLVQG